MSSFHETNLRTYVHHQGVPGVWFFSLDAESRLAVHLARAFWSLPYHHATMALERAPDGLTRHHTQRRSGHAHCTVRYRPTGQPKPAEPGTLEHFLVERYFLYARGKSGLLRAQVHHSAYPLQSADVLALDESLLATLGFAPSTTALVHYASEVRVEIFPLRPV